MKYAVAVLLGAVAVNHASAVKFLNYDDTGDVANIREFYEREAQRPLDFVATQTEFRPNPAQAPWAAPPNPAATTAITGAYRTQDDGSDYYNRVTPDVDDLLMRSLIQNYALEGRGANGPTGQFYMDHNAMEGVAEEIVRTHLGYTGAQKADFIKTNLARCWKHFDVLNKGFLVVQEVPQFLKSFLGEVELNNNLQLQLGEEGALASEFRPNPVQSPWAAKPAPPSPATAITGAYPHDASKDVLGYERVVPEHFSTEADDRLMHSLITRYALEGSDAGKPNGKFYLTRSGTKQVATEVAATHLKLSGSKLDSYVDEKMNQLWKHYDVLGDGFVPADRVPVLLRSMIGDVEINNGLQLQIGAEN